MPILHLTPPGRHATQRTRTMRRAAYRHAPQLTDYTVTLLGCVYAVLYAAGKLSTWAQVEAEVCKPSAPAQVTWG